jgi:hypothetical protein
MHADTQHRQQARKREDKGVAVDAIAAGQDRQYHRRPEKRAAGETARVPQSRASASNAHALYTQLSQ